MTQAIIRLAGVELSLNSGAGPVHILRGIDLQIFPGEAVGIVGPSGSGKSSMMAIMTGMEQASAGEVMIDGQDYSALNEDQLALHRRARVGVVLQAFHLIPTMTALENVAVPLELAGRADAFDRAAATLERGSLGERLTHYPSQLSGGEQQRVALARAVAPGPAILFADEPTGNLDSQTGEAIVDLMFALQRETAATLVLITHDPDLAQRCDRIVSMADGRIEAPRPALKVSADA